MAPDIYTVSEETGMNEMGEFDVSPEFRPAVLRGVSACPERAITVLVDVAAGEVAP
jgi:ferredoxin